jgi:molecular chaperone HtpG
VSHTFQVDLRGVVDLLSNHLYASPRVYVRELLQNAVDAITARQAVEPDAPSRVRIEPPAVTGDGTLRISDTGIGLTEAQVHELLATIGRSGKRDELGFARHEFLGQFGIGLLSCFLVADEVMVVTRAGDAPTVRWTGYGDGRYDVTQPAESRSEVGTTVTLTPRRGAEHWLEAALVTELATRYGSLLPVLVSVAGPDGDVRITEGTPPWLSDSAERAATRTYAREVLEIDPFDIVDLSAPEAGLTGAAFILDAPTSPRSRGGHRVYLKRMLLTEQADGLLPEWAFFARCVIDTSELRPTASREALYEDGLLESVREALGQQVRGWLVGLAARDPRRLGQFLAIHHVGVKSLALHDDEMLRLVEQWWPMETNVGEMTLAEFRQRYGLIRYSPTRDEFRQVAAVAAAQHLPVVNAGYAFDADLIRRLGELEPDVRVERLDPSDLATRFEAVEPAVELALRPVLALAQRAMDPLGVELILRAYEPGSLACIYLLDRDAAFRGELRATREKSEPLWADVLSALEEQSRDVRPQLVLNHRNTLVRRILALPDPSLVRLAIESLYGQALLLGYHPIRPADAALLNRSFLGLLDRALPGEVE